MCRLRPDPFRLPPEVLYWKDCCLFFPLNGLSRDLGDPEILRAPVEKRVGRSERKEAMTKGEQEVGVLRSSDEAGEPTQGTQPSEGGTELQNHSRER